VFRVPTVADIAASPTNSSVTFIDPCTGLTAAKVAANPNLSKACQGVPQDGTFAEPNGQITGLITSNPNLKPETGTVTTFGVVYEPSQVKGLSMSVDFWTYKIENLITTLDPTYSMGQCVATGSDYFCSLVNRFTSGANTGQILVFLAPTYNLGELKTNGVDFGVKFTLPETVAGKFRVSMDVTRTDSYKNTPAPGAVPQEIAGTYSRQFGNYAKTRVLGSIGWALKSADALLTFRYIGSIVLPNPSVTGTEPDLPISAFTYIDLTAGYTLPTKDPVPDRCTESDG